MFIVIIIILQKYREKKSLEFGNPLPLDNFQTQADFLQDDIPKKLCQPQTFQIFIEH